MLMSYQGQGDPTGAVGLELDIIAATVIGGGSLSGGEGSVAGSLIGAMIMTVIRTGCQLNGWPTWVTQVVTGAVIIIAVAVDRLRHRNHQIQ
jgi:ribose transport system permease protein